MEQQTREERVQQRLRGASRRPVKEVDFGLSIPAAAPVQSSPPASTAVPPQPESSPQPPPNERSPSILPPPPPSSILENTKSATSHSVNDANTSAKRKKLDSDPAPVPSARSTRSSRIPRPDVYALLDDDEQSEETGLEEIVNTPPERVIDAENSVSVLQENTTILDVVPEPTATPSVHFAEETTVISIDVPMADELSMQGLEESIVSPIQETDDVSLPQLSEIETPVPARKRKRGVSEEARKRPKRPAPVEEDEMDELSPEQPARSIPRAKATVRDPIDDGEQDPLSDPAEPEEAEGIDDQKAAAILSKTRGRKKSIDPAAASREEDIEALELPKSKRQRRQERQDSNRAEQRQPKKAATKNTKASRKPSGKAKLRAGSPIPITIQRLTRGPVYEEEDLDADILNAEISHRKRAGVNPIDVLRGLCQEIVGSAIETLNDGQRNSEDPALKREYLTKSRAVEAFGNEVDTRLVEHTVNLDNTYSLERRVRDENKKKLSLREDILRIRAEREKVALRMDEIRIRHENEASSSRELTTLNTVVHDIELAVSRGQAAVPDENSTTQTPDISNIEIHLKRVASEVSKKGSSGGLLKRIREFNGFLERAALALETRRV